MSNWKTTREDYELEESQYWEEQDRQLEKIKIEEYWDQQDQLLSESNEFNREMDELELDSIKYSRLTCEYRPEEEVHDPRFDILCMDLDDPYFTPNPELEEYDAKLEQAYMRCEEEGEEREDFDIEFIPE